MNLPDRVRGFIYQRTAELFERRLALQKHKTPLISFTFDDFPKSALRVGGSMLIQAGVRGTFYVAMGQVDRQSSVGAIFSPGDLRQLAEAGHEIGCHTYSHLSCYQARDGQASKECLRNQQELSSVLASYHMRNFAFPYGHATLQTKRELSEQYESCRTTRIGINQGLVDLAYLRANGLYSKYPLDEVRKLIWRNLEHPGWLIFYTHDIDPAPSEFGCTPDYFHAVLMEAISSSAKIVTVAEALQDFQRR